MALKFVLTKKALVGDFRRGFDLYRGWNGVLCEFVKLDFAVHITNYRSFKWKFVWWYL